MTQNEFFNILMDELKDIPESRLYEVIRYYQNYFFKNAEYNKSEEEIVSQLERPEIIAQRILKANNLKKEFDFNDIESDNVQSVISTVNSSITDEIKPPPSINNTDSTNNTGKSFNTNFVLKLAIIILSIFILFPILISVGSILFNILGLCIQIIFESFNLAIGKDLIPVTNLSIIPSFILEFPQYVLVTFSIGTVFLSLFFILIIFYLLKLIYLLLNNLINTLRKKKGD